MMYFFMSSRHLALTLILQWGNRNAVGQGQKHTLTLMCAHTNTNTNTRTHTHTNTIQPSMQGATPTAPGGKQAVKKTQDYNNLAANHAAWHWIDCVPR